MLVPNSASRLGTAQVLSPHPANQTQVLDEPTNHLDLQTVEALGNALKDGTDSKLRSHVASTSVSPEDFQGSVVVTSHDRRLLREVCTASRQQKLSACCFVRCSAFSRPTHGFLRTFLQSRTSSL